MPKIEETVYYCDRCGKKIASNDDVHHIGRFRYLHVFKWFVPTSTLRYPLIYICGDCFKSFKEWYGGKDEQDH